MIKKYLKSILMCINFEVPEGIFPISDLEHLEEQLLKTFHKNSNL
jgi:hypothetical protein